MDHPDADGVIETEIDGVRTFWAPCEGPLRAALAFRAGSADETYRTSGLSHLVEHLALYGIDDPTRHNNGFVDQLSTVFHTHGDATTVNAFLAQVCMNLSRLPGGRLPDERRILAAEREGRRPGVVTTMNVWRFGARAHGLSGAGSQAEQVLTLDEAQAWAGSRFTTGNAVLWLSGPPPQGLRLPLPDGAWHAPVEPRTILPHAPGWFTLEFGGIGVGAVVPRTSASTLLASLAESEIHRVLRLDRALSYSPWVSYERLSVDAAHLVLFADGAEATLTDLSAAFADVVAGLPAAVPGRLAEQQDLLARRRAEALRDQPDDVRFGAVTSAATDALHGRPHRTLGDLADQDAATTPAEVAAAAEAFLRDALYLLPGKAKLRDGYGANVPGSLHPALRQPTARWHKDFPAVPHRLAVTAEGVTRLLGDGSHVTVRYDDLVGAVLYDDGAVTLVGGDSTHLAIEPGLWRGGAKAAHAAIMAVPAEAVMRLPGRPADEIPRPRASWWDRLQGLRALTATTRGTAVAATLVILPLVTLAVAGGNYAPTVLGGVVLTRLWLRVRRGRAG